MLGGFWTDAGAASEEVQVITINGVAEPADQYTYRLEEFRVPEGTGALEIAFDYTGKQIVSEIEIGLFDPNGFRGTSRFSKSSFYISRYRTTPSYFPGPVEEGIWEISLGFPTVRAETEYRVTIRLIPKDHPEYYGPLSEPLKEEPGWYQGDFHTHTGHSDAFSCEDTEGNRSPCQVYQVAEAAHRNNLDFVAIADHNTVSHHQDMMGLQPTFPELLLIRGQEVTTFYGHANIYGTSQPVDFRIGYEGKHVGDIQREAAGLDAMFSINHPGRETGASCTGCGWSADSTDYHRLEVIEIVNGTNVETDISGIPFWHDLLNQGYRITAIGGSDDHGAGFGSAQPGTPTTVVRAGNLSEKAILQGVRSGRVYLKTEQADTPDITFHASAGAMQWEMGSTISVREHSGEAISFSLTTSPQEGLSAEWIMNGETVEVQTTPQRLEDGSIAFTYTLENPSPGWLRSNLRRGQNISIITNPVYFE